jgi:hypothetical protein
MRLEDLDVFRAVHETGNFQRAALRCGLSQSAVTKVVCKLDGEFGVHLMERGGRSLALTLPSRTLYQRAIDLARSLPRRGERWTVRWLRCVERYGSASYRRCRQAPLSRTVRDLKRLGVALFV